MGVDTFPSTPTTKEKSSNLRQCNQITQKFFTDSKRHCPIQYYRNIICREIKRIVSLQYDIQQTREAICFNELSQEKIKTLKKEIDECDENIQICSQEIQRLKSLIK